MDQETEDIREVMRLRLLVIEQEQEISRLRDALKVAQRRTEITERQAGELSARAHAAESALWWERMAREVREQVRRAQPVVVPRDGDAIAYDPEHAPGRAA